MRNLIIQPHSDDALLSCFSVIKDCDILTIEDNGARRKEDALIKNFFPKVNLKFFPLSLVDTTYKEFWDNHKIYSKHNVVNFLNSIYDIEKIRTILISGPLHNYSNIYIPLGIGHPFHYLITYCFEEIKGDYNLIYYREWPHSYKRRNKEFISLEVSPYYELIKTESEESLKQKFEIAKTIYKSQSSLFFFEQRNFENYKEEFYKKRNKSKVLF